MQVLLVAGGTRYATALSSAGVVSHRVQHISNASDAVTAYMMDAVAVCTGFGADALELIEGHAADSPIVALMPRYDARAAGRYLRAGAEECCVPDELHPVVLRRLLEHAAVRHAARAEALAERDIDPLTGLLNRRGLESALRGVRKRGDPVTAVLVDIDDFKAVNDAAGHTGGDLVLKAIADCLRGQARDGDVVSRVGGDEFMVLVPEEVAGAQAVLERARAAIARLPGSVTVSMGMARIATPSDISALLLRTEAGLQHSKRTGKDRMSVVEGAA